MEKPVVFVVDDDASEFTWNVYAGPTFKVSDKVTIVAGYSINCSEET